MDIAAVVIGGVTFLGAAIYTLNSPWDTPWGLF